MPKLRSRLPEIKDYPKFLSKMWDKYLQEKDKDAPTVISTFAGCGGSSLGYSMAGFRELLAVEWNDNAVKTFKLNFPDVPVYHGDIYKLSAEQCLELADIEPGKLDILDGSPPCQGFSIAGKREYRDIRNQLSFQFIRLLRGLKPKVFVMENVSGMVKGKMKLIFADILKELKASGYNVSARLLNAKWLGVPQSRERLIFIGVRDDLGIKPSFPGVKYRPINVRGAWGENSLVGDKVKIGKDTETYKWMSRVKPGQAISDIHPDGYYFNFRRLEYNKPSPTLIKNGGKQLIHPEITRTLTVPEYKRLGSFPDGFILIGGAEDKTFRIGNSVPPLMMYYIAKHIRENILDRLRA